MLGNRVSLYLRGEAKRFWTELEPNEKYNNRAIKQFLIDKIDTVEKRADAKLEYLTAAQKPGETVTDFSRRLWNIYQNAGGNLRYTNNDELTESFLIKRFESSLSPTFSLHAKSRNLLRWDEVTAFAKKLDQQLATSPVSKPQQL